MTGDTKGWAGECRKFARADFNVAELCRVVYYWVVHKLPQIYAAKSRNLPNTDTQNYSTDLR